MGVSVSRQVSVVATQIRAVFAKTTQGFHSMSNMHNLPNSSKVDEDLSFAVPESCVKLASLHALGLKRDHSLSNVKYYSIDMHKLLLDRGWLHAKCNQSAQLEEYALQNHEEPLNCLAHLSGIHDLLFVTNAEGALSALRCPVVYVFAVCDYETHFAALHSAPHNPGASYIHFCIETATTAKAFCQQFLLPAVCIARRMAEVAVSMQKQPMVVHCTDGTNNCCAAVCMACIIDELAEFSSHTYTFGCAAARCVQLVVYIKCVNHHVRSQVLTNTQFVRFIVMFSEFAHAKLKQTNMYSSSLERMLETLANEYQDYCNMHSTDFYTYFDQLELL